MDSFTVIVPTLNEEQNVDKLLEQLFRVKNDCRLDFDIIFVDSASTDNTCRKVERWQNGYPVALLSRKVNLGLADAVITGAKHAKNDCVVVMDADLSHPPGIIPELVQPVLEGSYDMVVGSRYVRGGAMPDWPLSRKLSSKVATLPALLFCSIKDPLAGFFAVTRNLLTTLPGSVPGFKIGLAILAENQSWLRVKEIPIVFRDRDFGESKMNRKVILEYFRQLRQLTLKKIRGR
jgi:dolichol-phosphate mannosyltransferase